MTDERPRDWRGTPIESGKLVIYGAPVGRSIAMVEATVADPMLTPSGRIWLDVARRSYGGWGDGKRRVHVGADRLTVVTELPPTVLPTEAEKHETAERRRQAMDAHLDGIHEREGHQGPPSGYQERQYNAASHWRGTQTWQEWVPCPDCTAARLRFDEAWEAGDISD